MISMVDYEQNSATAPQNYFPVVNLQIQQKQVRCISLLRGCWAGDFYFFNANLD